MAGKSDVIDVGASVVDAQGAYFSSSWTAFQTERGRDFSVIVDRIQIDRGRCFGAIVDDSGGYWNAHSEDEWLDLLHLDAICRAAVLLNWECLPTIRKVAGSCGDGETSPFYGNDLSTRHTPALEVCAQETQ